MFDNVHYFLNIEIFNVWMFANIQMFESSNVRTFANIQMFGCSMFECSLMFGCSHEQTFEHWTQIFNVRWPLLIKTWWPDYYYHNLWFIRAVPRAGNFYSSCLSQVKLQRNCTGMTRAAWGLLQKKLFSQQLFLIDARMSDCFKGFWRLSFICLLSGH